MIDSSRLSLGRYLPVPTWLHGVDPRTKIVCGTVTIAALFLAPSWHAWGTALVAVWLLFPASGLPLRYAAGNLRPLIPILALTVGLNAWLTPGDRILAGWPFTAEGLARGGALSLRLIVIVTSTALVSLTTSPLDLADGLRWLFAPLALLRVPVHELALTATIALRLIPLLADEGVRIRNAQVSRGAVTRGSLTRRLRDIGSILIPLFVSAFARADRLADAMEARGYRGAQGRTRYRRLRFGAVDLAVLAGSLAFSVGAATVDLR